jgi:hypothetical protein
MAFRCAVVMRGMSIPFEVETTSSKAEVSAGAPVLLMAKPWALAWEQAIALRVNIINPKRKE